MSQRYTDLTSKEGFSKEEMQEVVFGFLLPEYRSKENIQKYSRDFINSILVDKGFSYLDLSQSSGELVEDIERNLSERNTNSLDGRVVSHVCLALGIGLNEVLPINNSLPEEAYKEAYKEITGRHLNDLPFGDASLPIVMMMKDFVFD